MKTEINVGEKWVNRSKGGRIDEVVSVSMNLREPKWSLLRYRTPKGRVCTSYAINFIRNHVKSLEVA